MASSNTAKKLPDTGTVDPMDIPEVVDFMDAKDKFESFKEHYADVFAQLEELAQEYNATLEAADKAVRAQQVSCGPFDAFQWSTKYSADTLYDLVGKEKFIEYGGKISTVTQYEVDKSRVESLIATHKIPHKVVEAFRKRSPSYRRIPRIEIP